MSLVKIVDLFKNSDLQRLELLFLGREKFIRKFLILQFKDLYYLYILRTFESFCDLRPDDWFADDDLVYPHVFSNVV